MKSAEKPPSATGFRLDGGGDSLVFLTSPVGAPELAYWAPELDRAPAFDVLASLIDRPAAPSQVEGSQKLTWLPQAGEGFSGWPSLLAHRQGRLTIAQPRMTELVAEADHARVVLADEAAGVELRLMLEIDPISAVLASRVELANTGPGPLSVEWLAAGALPTDHAEWLVFDGRWGREFIPARQRLTTGIVLKESRSGRTSHHAPPFAVIGEAGFDEAHGEVFAAHLAWSGNHRLLAERLPGGRIQLQAGELFDPGEMTLEPGETYSTPTLYLARSSGGLTGLSDRLHAFVRDRILAGRLNKKPRQVHFNTWEAIYFDHESGRLTALADLAAKIGVERFVLDDGWLRGRADDRAGLGDWTADRAKYPGGLGPLIAHVRGLGMEFGLWVEPEMANADSDLLRAHPDWILGEVGRVQPLGRNQFVLDLTRGEVRTAIFDQLHTLLSDNDIAYLKWDMNRDLTHPVSGGRAATHRQTLAVYALIDALRAAHPGVEIESCASGGGRADYEILRRTERVWTSDCNDPVERQLIQRGFSIFFPPEVMGAHVGPRASHSTARVTSLRMRALTALTGHMGVEADLLAMNAGERTELAAAIALHKRLRPWMHGARTVRLEHPEPGCVAQALVSYGAALVTAAQVETPRTATLAPVRVRGLDAKALYRAEPLLPPRRARATVRHSHLLARGEPIVASGGLLAHMGLPLPALRAGEIAAWLLTREDP